MKIIFPTLSTKMNFLEQQLKLINEAKERLTHIFKE